MLHTPTHYPTLHAFFDCYSLPHARHLLSRAIKAAASEKIWKTGSPAHLLSFIQRLEQLSAAVYELTQRCDYRDEVMLAASNSEDHWFLQHYPSYCGRDAGFTPWDYFPRHLTRKEYLDPYRALRKFTRFYSLEQWKAIYHDLLEYGLSPSCLPDMDDGTSLLTLSQQLHKLLEAAHLVEVRVEDEKVIARRKWSERG